MMVIAPRGLAAIALVVMLAGCFSTSRQSSASQTGAPQNSATQTNASDTSSSSPGFPGDNTTPPPNVTGDNSSQSQSTAAADISKISTSGGELVVEGNFTNNFSSDDAACDTSSFVLAANGQEATSSTGDPCDDSSVSNGSSTPFRVTFDNVSAGTYDLKVARSNGEWEHHQITVAP
jgi:hypothetical protein